MKIVGIGTNVVECLRIARMIERHGELFLNRAYTSREIRYCQSRKQATQHFAARWAAKEAVLKALGSGWIRGINWSDIEIRNDSGGKTTAAFRGGAKQLIERLHVTQLLVSMSYCRTHATAYAMAIDEREAP
jgi:holo-[acyl-carrier protein] synthase